MKVLEEMTKDEIARVQAVFFDIDGVVMPVGTKLQENEDGTELFIKTHKLSPSFVENLEKLKERFIIGFSSGRNILYLKSLTDEFFDRRVVLQAENGNITWFNGKIVHPVYTDGYFKKLRKIKERLKKMMKKDRIIRGFEPKFFILTVHSDKTEEIPALVRELDPENELYCLWTGEGYDIGSKEMTKGKAILELAEKLGIEPKQIITTGNNYNDKEMLQIGLGVSVAPGRVKGDYFIKPTRTELGGQILARFLRDRIRAF